MVNIKSDSVESTKMKIFVGVLVSLYVLPFFLFKNVASLLGDNSTLKYLVTVFFGVFLYVLAFVAIKRDGIALDSIGFSAKKFRQAAMLILVGWGVFASLIIPLNVLVARESIWASFESSPLAIVKQWLFVGLAEEVLVRGYILIKLLGYLRKLSRIWRTGLALILANVIFATAHLPRMALMQNLDLPVIAKDLTLLFIAGIAFSYFFLRTRNVILAGFIHGSLSAPPVGVQGDHFPILVFMAVVEIYLFFERRQSREKATVQLEEA